MERTGLRGRSIAFCVALLIGAVASVSSPLIYRNHQTAIDNLTDQARLHSASVGYNSEPGLLLNDRPALERVVRGCAQDGNLLSARVLDSKGETLALFEREHGGPKELFLNPGDPLEGPVLPGACLLRRSANELMVVSPVFQTADYSELEPEEGVAKGAKRAEGAIGYVQLLYGLETIHARLYQGVATSVGIALLVMAIAIGITVVGARQLLKPIANLVEATSDLARGDLRRRASEEAVGEVGTLARSFNHMADRLQESYESIERTVAERTAELVRANRAKSDFLANMSHEIRTPMTAILGYSEHLAEKGCTDAEREQIVGIIRRNGDHLLQIINDILDLTAIEANRLTVERTAVPLGRLVKEVIEASRGPAEARGLRLSLHCPGPIPQVVQTDATRLRQILMNLLKNAVKFTEAGEVSCTLRLERPGNARPLLRFDIRDTGIGMTPEQLDRAFEAFTQADETMSRRFGGTGLGLTISRRLAGLLGGDVTAESRPGCGSNFTLTIDPGALEGVPLGPLEGQPPTGETKPRSGAPEAPLARCRILLVEDGPDNQRLISHILKKAGAEVEVAENGKLGLDAAWEALTSGRAFDVILMDMQMPVMDGYSATGELRARGYAGPILAITAHAMLGDREKCLQAGCDEYASKPIARDKLIEMIRAHLTPARQRNSPQPVQA
jgi:signal transduction histidine kinase/ActR/RegA family two-component response regulator